MPACAESYGFDSKKRCNASVTSAGCSCTIQWVAPGDGVALLNRLKLEGQATAADVVDAARTIQGKVKEAWGIRMVPEPVFAGFAADDVLPEGALRAR